MVPLHFILCRKLDVCTCKCSILYRGLRVCSCKCSILYRRSRVRSCKCLILYRRSRVCSCKCLILCRGSRVCSCKCLILCRGSRKTVPLLIILNRISITNFYCLLKTKFSCSSLSGLLIIFLSLFSKNIDGVANTLYCLTIRPCHPFKSQR